MKSQNGVGLRPTSEKRTTTTSLPLTPEDATVVFAVDVAAVLTTVTTAMLLVVVGGPGGGGVLATWRRDFV